MSDIKKEDELTNSRMDYLVTALKGTLGIVPFGSLAAEAIGTAIPKQRVDRMVEVIRRVEERLGQLEHEFEPVRLRFSTPEFQDVFEEAVLQAGKALSVERREHLASILVKSLTEDEFQNARVKKLLFMLNDLTDPEIIVLTYTNLSRRENQLSFFELHEEILRPVPLVMGCSREDREQSGLQKSWRQRLEQLGLVDPTQKGVNAVTSLGRMFLRYIDAPRDWDLG